MADLIIDGEIVLYGFVGDNWFDTGFTAHDVVAALATLGRDTDVTVRINSGGGYVDDGIAIYNALAAHKGKVTIVVDGQAASSASVIVMAGDERVMRSGSMLMIHDPAGGVWGTAEDMRKGADMVEKWANQIAGIYADTSGNDAETVRDAMLDETWMTGAEAVAAGYATATSDDAAVTASAFDYRIYAHAPDDLRAMADANSWRVKSPKASGGQKPAAKRASASAPAATRQHKEKPMTDKTTAAQTAAAPADDAAKVTADAVATAIKAERERRAGVMALDEYKGREKQADHLINSTDLSVDAIKGILAAAPVASAADGKAAGLADRDTLAAAGIETDGKPVKAAPVINRKEIFANRRAAK